MSSWTTTPTGNRDDCIEMKPMLSEKGWSYFKSKMYKRFSLVFFLRIFFVEINFCYLRMACFISCFCIPVVCQHLSSSLKSYAYALKFVVKKKASVCIYCWLGN